MAGSAIGTAAQVVCAGFVQIELLSSVIHLLMISLLGLMLKMSSLLGAITATHAELC